MIFLLNIYITLHFVTSSHNFLFLNSGVPLSRFLEAVHQVHPGTDSSAIVGHVSGFVGVVDWVWVAPTALLFPFYLGSWLLRTRLLIGSLLRSSSSFATFLLLIYVMDALRLISSGRSDCRNSLARKCKEQKQIEDRSFFRCDPKLLVKRIHQRDLLCRTIHIRVRRPPPSHAFASSTALTYVMCSIHIHTSI